MNSHKTALFWQYRTHFLHSEMVSNNYTIVSKSDEPLRLEELIGESDHLNSSIVASTFSSITTERQKSNHNGHQFLDLFACSRASRIGMDAKSHEFVT